MNDSINNPTAPKVQTLVIRVPSLVENIRIVESFIDNANEKYNFSDDIYGNVMVAVTEAVNNAIQHGNKSNSDKMVRLELINGENNLRFLISDEGVGYDPSQLPDPTAPENLDKPGGRGIFLMKSLCDEVNFTDSGRKVELVFYF